MSERYDAIWVRGETWTIPVDCTDVSGDAFNPTEAAWTLVPIDGSEAVLDYTHEEGITLATSRATINVPTVQQEDVPDGIYSHALVTRDSGGALSRQIDGVIVVGTR